MNSDPPSPRDGASDARGPERRDRASSIVTYQYDARGRITTARDSLEACSPEPAWGVHRDTEKRVFRLTAPEGKVEHFRDQGQRFLVLEPDEPTGELRPAIRNGKPWILCLCREEREIQ